MIAGGNIRRQEDVKKILYTGAKRAMLNLSKPVVHRDAGLRMRQNDLEKSGLPFHLNDFDALFKQQHLIEELQQQRLSLCIRLDLNSVMNVTEMYRASMLTDTMEEEQRFSKF